MSQHPDPVREALERAESALRDARDGLDFGLGHARKLEGDEHPIPVGPRSKQMDAYLKRARIAHAAVLAALADPPLGSVERPIARGDLWERDFNGVLGGATRADAEAYADRMARKRAPTRTGEQAAAEYSSALAKELGLSARVEQVGGDERAWTLTCENYVWHAKPNDKVPTAKSAPPVVVVPAKPSLEDEQQRRSK